MNIKDEDMEWEMDAPRLAALPRITPYCVPDNYFNDLTEHLQSFASLSNLTSTEESGFTVPSNYFVALNEQIKSRIALEQFRSIGFSTPSNYFDKLQASILEQTVNTKPPAKVVRLWHTDLVKYAVAACFILVAASGLYINEQRKVSEVQSTELASEVMLYDIDESVIIEHLAESQTATNATASQAEIESYILENYSSNDLSNNL
ncbi:MAG: hypothetical protein ACQUHE_19135 [Bacteroidia bacterium]